jgi:hypothetical protein
MIKLALAAVGTWVGLVVNVPWNPAPLAPSLLAAQKGFKPRMMRSFAGSPGRQRALVFLPKSANKQKRQQHGSGHG